MIKVRLAQDADAAALAEIAERTFRDTFAASNTAEDMDAHCASAYGEAIQLAELRNPYWITFAAESGGGLIGFAQLRLSRPTASVTAERPCELYRIYVDRAWHGRGVAQRLMNESLSVARARHADWLWLGVWERNPRAQAFYRKFGFREVGEHTFMVGSDAQRDLIMARQIAVTFFLDRLPVGQFAEEDFPRADGRHRYMPFRGPGHLAMGTALRDGKHPRCHYDAGNKRVKFTVRECPEYGVVVLSDFEGT